MWRANVANHLSTAVADPLTSSGQLDRSCRQKQLSSTHGSIINCMRACNAVCAFQCDAIRCDALRYGFQEEDLVDGSSHRNDVGTSEETPSTTPPPSDLLRPSTHYYPGGEASAEPTRPSVARGFEMPMLNGTGSWASFEPPSGATVELFRSSLRLYYCFIFHAPLALGLQPK